jgi:hypothetical protein
MGKPGRPTRSQRELILQNGYNPSSYLVISNEPRKMRLLNVVTGDRVIIKKKPQEQQLPGYQRNL